LYQPHNFSKRTRNRKAGIAMSSILPYASTMAFLWHKNNKRGGGFQ